MKIGALLFMDISILVPTKNREEYVYKIIKYYNELNFLGRIYILDSSDKLISEKIYNNLQLNNPNKNIFYRHSIGLPGMVMKDHISLIETKYVVETGDDDYLALNGVKKVVNFLDNNLDYAGAHGKGKLILSRKKNTQIDDVIDYFQCIRKEETSLDRAIFLLKNYQVPNFAVYRTNVFKKILKGIPSQNDLHLCPDRKFADELVQATLSVVYTKLKSLDCFYIGRHITSVRKNIRKIISKETEEATSISKKYLTNLLVELISKEDKISKDEVKIKISEAIEYYLETEYKNHNNIFFKKVGGFIKNFINNNYNKNKINLLEKDPFYEEISFIKNIILN
jgi:glycosyltransferase domain-containing protein